MNQIEPGVAARLADGVYGIREQNNVDRGMALRGVTGLDEHIDFSKTKVASSVSGVGSFSKESGFLMIAPCKKKFKDEYVVAIRGTASGTDWLTNIHATFDQGPMGLRVHAGFNNVFKSLQVSLHKELQGKNPARIHCIGHSLGGAVANIAALALSEVGHSVSLYTFGAPRAGSVAMAQQLDRNVGSENIYRVYNQSDVVPLVPIYPFVHSPRNESGLLVKTAGSLFSIDAHFMGSYTPAVDGKNWSDFRISRGAIPIHKRVDQWIDRADAHVRIPGSSLGFWALGNALKAIIDLAAAVGGITYAIGATVFDYLAQMLMKALVMSNANGERILRWMKLALKFAGKTTMTVGKNVTTVFIRWVLELLLRPMLTLAHRAIHIGSR